MLKSSSGLEFYIGSSGTTETITTQTTVAPTTAAPPTVQLVDGKYPEISVDGVWVPICGHWFWDNSYGATLFCQQLDPKFVVGTVMKANKRLEADGIQIGKCRSSDAWLACTGGCNDLVIGKGCANCRADSSKAMIEIECKEGKQTDG